MDQMNQILEWIKNIDLKQIINFLIAIGIVIFFYLISSTLAYIIVKIFKIKIKEKEKIKEKAFYGPLKIFFTVLGVYLATKVLSFPEVVVGWIDKIFQSIVILLVANGFGNMFTTDSETLKKIQAKLKMDVDDNRLSFFYKLIRVIIYIVAVLLVIMRLGFNINGILAGFGVGGVIITLAAQDTAKNLFGGFMLIVDKPFVVGDWVQTASFEGIVEDITFRSTRIRTWDNSLVNIPNGVLSNESIINWSKMEKRKYKLDIKLDLDTPMEVVKRVTSKIYFMLINHPNVINEDTYVKFDTIKPDGINIMIYVFTNSVDYDTYLNAKEKINGNIMEILEHENVKIAYPTSTVFVKNEEKEEE